MSGQHRAPAIHDHSDRWLLISLVVMISSFWTAIVAGLSSSTWPMIFIIPHLIGFIYTFNRSLKALR